MIQFRNTVTVTVADRGDDTGRPASKHVKPYLMDLNSANKTSLNGKVIDNSRFIELRESDVISFGYSSREYVLVRE